jgi:hypothetical protein
MPRRLCDSLSKMGAPTQFAEVGSVLSWKHGILKAKLHCGECAITWEVFHGPEEVGRFNLLSHGSTFFRIEWNSRRRYILGLAAKIL